MNALLSPRLAISLVRIFTGLMFLSAGLNKVLIVGTENFSKFVHTLGGLGMFQDIVALILPWAEILLGLLLIFGVGTTIVAFLIAGSFLLMSLTLGFFSKPGELLISYHGFGFLMSLSLMFVGKEQTMWSFDEWFKKKQKEKNVKKIKV